MLGKYAAAYVIIVEMIDGLISTLEDTTAKNNRASSDTNTKMLALALIGKEPKLPDHVADRIRIVLESLLEQVVSRMTFPSVTAQANRILEAIKHGEGPKALAINMRELKTRLKDELSEREFLYVSPERAKFYKQPMLFGKGVNDRFPMAIDDIEEAGRRYRRGREVSRLGARNGMCAAYYACT